MVSVLAGFSTVVFAIAVGWWLAQRGIFGDSSHRVLADTSFYVGSPALLFLLMYRANLAAVFSWPLFVTAAAAVAAMALWVAVALLRGRRDVSTLTIEALLAGYVNSANIGIPVAAYMLGDMTWVAPLLLLQVCLLQPLALTVLDTQQLKNSPGARPLVANIVAPLRNPLTVSAFAGVALQLVGIQLPSPVIMPLELLGQLAVGTMLLAFGISLHIDGFPRARSGLATIAGLTIVKAWLHPLIAYGLAAVMQLSASATMACTVLAALPSAQNIFLISLKYNTAMPVARGTIAVNTIVALPTLLVLALVLSPSG